jgi:transposase
MSTSSIYLGLDVHKESVTIAVLPEGEAAPTRVERLPYDLKKLHRFFSRLAPTGALRACYEASGAGYVLHRAITSWGHHCEVIASALIPTKPGERRKHDKHDAAQLARLYRAGELTPIRIPSADEERVREIVRCRETLQRELLRSRHYLLKLLFCRGLIYHDGTHWTGRHRRWLTEVRRAGVLTGGDAVAFDEYLALLEYKLARRDALDREIAQLAFTPTYQPTVARLQCYRGISTLGAMVLATEIVDWHRFAKPTQLMAYLGLVPTEHSSGTRERRGAITKAGNSRCRHILVQAAWAQRRPPARSFLLRRRQQGQPATVVAHAWKAQHRLYTLFQRLAHRRSPPIAAVGVARELVGFLWATMHDQSIPDHAIPALATTA